MINQIEHWWNFWKDYNIVSGSWPCWASSIVLLFSRGPCKFDWTNGDGSGARHSPWATFSLPKAPTRASSIAGHFSTWENHGNAAKAGSCDFKQRWWGGEVHGCGLYLISFNTVKTLRLYPNRKLTLYFYAKIIMNCVSSSNKFDILSLIPNFMSD